MPDTQSAGFEPEFDPRDYQVNLDDFPNRSRGRGVSVRLHHPLPPRDQGAVNCCMSCALATCMEILDLQRAPSVNLNVLYHYWMARRMARRRSTNNQGMSFQLGFDALISHGICAQDKHLRRINLQTIRRAPSPAAHRDAGRHQIAGRDGRREYHELPRTNRVRAFKQVLRSRHPIAMGFYLTDAYEALADSDVHLTPTRPSRTLHVATVVGYHDRKATPLGAGAFEVKDSRGTGFGHQGRWWMPYQLMNSRLIAQSWTITEISY